MNTEKNEVAGEEIDKNHIFLARREMANFLTRHDRSMALNASPSTAGLFSENEQNIGSTLDLSNKLLNDAEFMLLLPEIAKLPALSGLNLSVNLITGKSIEMMLGVLPHIQELDLTKCPRVKRNNGCQYLAQMKYLSTLDVTCDGLVSDDFDALTTSNSLTRVDWYQNEHVDPVRKGRLVAAIAFNCERFQKRFLKREENHPHEDPEQVRKERGEYINLHLKKFILIALQGEKSDKDDRAFMSRRHPKPYYLKL